VVLICLSCAWVAGVLLGSRFNLPWLYSLVGIAPLFLLFFFRSYRKIIILLSLSVIILPLAAAFSYSSQNAFDETDLRYYNDRGLTGLKGTVIEDPDVRDKNTRLMLSVSEISLDGEWQEINGKAMIYVPRYPAYEYGDLLAVSGEPLTPAQFDDFDYRGYLAHQGIYTTVFYPDTEVIDTGQGNIFLSRIYSLRNNLSERLMEILPEPQSSLAQGIILGIRGNIPPEISDDFSRSGTAHILAISGLHLSIMAGVMLGIGLWFFGRRYYLYVWLALGAVWLYVIITGMHLPVLRGAIMASMFLVAELLGRQRSAIVALVFAAAVMVGVWPYILGDASFQLSFLAMTGLVFIFPIFRNLGRKITARFFGEEGFTAATANVAVDALSATLGAVIAVWPVVAYYFGIISLVGPLATFLVLPALPGAIAMGGLGALLGLFVLPVAQVVGWIAWLFLSYILLLADGFSAAYVDVGSISPVFVWIYYLILAAALCIYSNWDRFRGSLPEATTRVKSKIRISFEMSRVMKWLLLPLLVVTVLVSSAAFTMPDDKLHVSFLDVGEGDAILIQKGNQQILIDGGPGPQAVNLELGSRMPFWDRTIDMVVLTHPHQDHISGLTEVLRRYNVEQVLYPDLDYASPLYDEWLSLIETDGIESVIACAGQRIDMGDGVIIDVLGPPALHLSGTQSDVDNNGIVLKISDGKVSFLLTADIMQEAERELVGNRADLASTVLKVGHHGSDTSSTPEFLAVVSPRIAVISVGPDNKFGHPDEDVLKRLVQAVGEENIYRTDLHGTIEFITDGESLWVEVEK
jgi:competence protein ComEC